MAYATRADIFKYALTKGQLANTAREADSVSASGDTVSLDSHGFVTDDPIVLRAAEGGSMPSPLVEGTTYYVIRETDATFKVAAVPGGDAINITTAGSNLIVSGDLPFDDVLEARSRFVDGFIPHLVPLDSPYPVAIVEVTALLAGARLLAMSGVSSDIVKEMEKGAIDQLQRWAKGQPIRDAGTTASSNKAVSISPASTSRWGTGDKIP